MPLAAIPIIPIADSVEFSELPLLMHAAVTKAPQYFSSGLFVFEVTPSCKQGTELPQVLLASIDFEMSNLIEHVITVVRTENFIQDEPFAFSPCLSQAFAHMQQDEITTASWTVRDDHGHSYQVALLRTPAIVDQFITEFRHASTVLDSCN